jgi:hypothetical protein
MNQTTEQPMIQNRSHTIILWVLTLAGAAIVPHDLLRHVSLYEGFFLTPFPWIPVGGWTINDGLQMFSGRLPLAHTSAQLMGCLVSVLVVYIAAPTLFLFGLRRRALERRLGRELHIIRWSTVQLVLGGALTIGAAFPSLPMALIQKQVSSTLFAAQQIQELKDQIIYDMNTIAWKLYEYRVLPKEQQGGGGVLAGFSIPRNLLKVKKVSYEMTVKDTLSVIIASAEGTEQGTIRASLNGRGRFLGWEFTGCFE